MKKRFLALICFLLLVPAFFLPVQATAGNAELVVNTANAQPGETVTFTAYLENYPQVNAIGVEVIVPEGITVQSGQWLLSNVKLKDYDKSNARGACISEETIDMTRKVAVFKLVCILDANTDQGQKHNYEVTVKFTVKAGKENQGSSQASATVGYAIPATGLELDKDTLALDLSDGKTGQLTAICTPENTTQTLTWSSNNEAVATVDADGKVTAVAEGNATITARLGNYTKSCQVAVTCGHSGMEEYKANEPTCKDTGNRLYYVCKTCGDVFQADKTTQTTVAAETLAVVDHKGGTATCMAQAVCIWCQQPYGSVAPHDFTEKIEDAAHLVPGSGKDCQSVKKYYYDCTACNTKGTTTFDSTAKGDHRMSSQWITENGVHFHKCTVSGCTYTADRANCSGGTATCTAKAVCSACHREYGDRKSHDFTEKIEDAAHLVPGSGVDCQSVKKYYYDCTACNTKGTTTFDGTAKGDHRMSSQWITENEVHFRKCMVSGCTYTADRASCSGGTATCTAKAVCSACHREYGNLKAHDFVEKVDIPATEDAVGRKHEECSVCKAKRNEGTEIPKLPHEHIGITAHDAIPATCVATGNVKYWTCSSNKCAGKYFEDESCTTELETIVTPLNPDNHTGTQVKDAKNPSCCQEGYTGDICCSAIGCGKKLVAGRTIPATGKHTASTQWFSDDAEHWHSCTTAGCTAKVDKKTHSYRWILDKAATESAVGMKHEECVCGAKRSEDTQIPKLDHVHDGIQYHGAVKATCVKEGILEYWTCSNRNCEGKYYGDQDCQLVLQSVVEPVDSSNHTGDRQIRGKAEASCSEDGYTGDIYCESCEAQIQKGDVIAATGEHTPKKDYEKDAQKHWKLCGDCGALIDNKKEEHMLVWVTDKSPTEFEEGKKHQQCTVCGYICNGDTVIEKLPHNLVYVKGKKPSCTEDGVADHFRCEMCGENLESADGKPGKEIAADAIRLPATGHSFDGGWKFNKDVHWKECACGEIGLKSAHTTELVNVKEATETETGYTGDKVCSACGYVVEEGKAIPALTPDETIDTKIEISEGGVASVPEALQQIGLKTPEEVKNAIVGALKNQNGEIVEKNVVHYDVTLQVSPDGGKTWITADEKNFPKNGKLTVVLPYPEGTDATYTFSVAHMFTSSAFGKIPGDVEFPHVTNTSEGIEFEVTGLSPISVGWTEPALKTYNPMIPIVIVGVACVGVLIAAVVILKKKRSQ